MPLASRIRPPPIGAPRAQAPRLALGQLARSTGTGDAAVAALEPLFALSADEQDRLDPWWTYLVSAGSNAEALLAEAYTRLSTPRAVTP